MRAVIATVKAGEPAANAGLRSGDVVVAINDAPVASFAQLRVGWPCLAPVANSCLTFIAMGKSSARQMF
ncbi:MAG: PDZ domain-containing protein [Pirellulaceae bacterium]